MKSLEEEGGEKKHLFSTQEDPVGMSEAEEDTQYGPGNSHSRFGREIGPTLSHREMSRRQERTFVREQSGASHRDGPDIVRRGRCSLPVGCLPSQKKHCLRKGKGLAGAAIDAERERNLRSGNPSKEHSTIGTPEVARIKYWEGGDRPKTIVQLFTKAGDISPGGGGYLGKEKSCNLPWVDWRHADRKGML